VSVCFSKRVRQAFASCCISELELPTEWLDSPETFTAGVQTAYTRCVEAVNAQLAACAADTGRHYDHRRPADRPPPASRRTAATPPPPAANGAPH
jgi:hypothetical protein